MKNILKQPDGYYHVNGKKYKLLRGSRAQVGHGTAYKTDYGLTLKGLKQNKSGKWVSLNKSKSAKRENRLVKSGYHTEKGKFGSFRKTKRV